MMSVEEKEAAGAERVPTLFINITTTPSTSQGLINKLAKGDLGRTDDKIFIKITMTHKPEGGGKDQEPGGRRALGQVVSGSPSDQPGGGDRGDSGGDGGGDGDGDGGGDHDIVEAFLTHRLVWSLFDIKMAKEM